MLLLFFCCFPLSRFVNLLFPLDFGFIFIITLLTNNFISFLVYVRFFSLWVRSQWWSMAVWRRSYSVDTLSMIQTIWSSVTLTMSTSGLLFPCISTLSICSSLYWPSSELLTVEELKREIATNFSRMCMLIIIIIYFLFLVSFFFFLFCYGWFAYWQIV